MYLVSAAQMRELDRLTIEQYGTPGHVLMERAGSGATQALLDFFEQRPKRVVVVAGRGNNGGDGFVMARLLKKQGIACEVILAAKKREVAGDARRNLQAFSRLRGRIEEVTALDQLPAAEKRLDRCDVIVDALLGTGLNTAVKGLQAALIASMNASGVPIVSVDIPSGLHADSGRPVGCAVEAALTVTFGYPKLGQVLYPGTAQVGQLACVDIGIAPQALTEVAPHLHVLTRREVGGQIRARQPESHKGNFGHLLVLAGARGKSGAAVLSASAALRAGTGLVTLAGPHGLIPIFSSVLLEAMTAPQPERADGSLRLNARVLSQALHGKSALVFGPGIGVSVETRRMARWLLKNSQVPLLIDADGLNCVASQVAMLKTAKVPVVLHSSSRRNVSAGRTVNRRHTSPAAGGCASVCHSVRLLSRPQGCPGALSLPPTVGPGSIQPGIRVWPVVAWATCCPALSAACSPRGMRPMRRVASACFCTGPLPTPLPSSMAQAGLLARDVIDNLPDTLRALSRAGRVDAHAAYDADILG